MGKILVTGASGHLGQAVIGHLLEAEKVPATNIVAASRDIAKLAELAEKGVELRRADFDDAASLDQAFSGVDTVLIISTDALGVSGQRLAQHKTAIAAAVRSGVQHLAYTSMPNPDASLVSFAPDHLGSEEAVKASGLAYSIIRNAWYYENYLHSMAHNLKTGQWFAATGTGRVANISRNDCARAAAAIIARPAENRVWTLTGPQSLTIEEIAAIVAQAANKPLAVIQVSAEQLKAGIEAAGLPDFIADMLVSFDANIAAGHFDLLSGDYESLTGEKPQSAAAFFDAHKAALEA